MEQLSKKLKAVCQSFYQSYKLEKCNKCILGQDNNTVRL